jgi:hypothetical protein
MLETLSFEPAVKTVHVTVDPAPMGLPPGTDLPPVNPLAVTVEATHRMELSPPERPPPAVPAHDTAVPEPAQPQESATASVSESGRFTAVRPGELDVAPRERPELPWISPQTWALVIGLLGLGFLAYYMLQPPSADALYRRIKGQVAEGSVDSLQRAKEDITQFLVRYPSDGRCQEVSEDQEQVETSLLENRLTLLARGMNLQPPPSAQERFYLDAMNSARVDVDLGIAKFQAMVDIFESPLENPSPGWRCIQLAKRRLEDLRQESETRHTEQLIAVGNRLDYADEVAAKDPARAEKIRGGVVALYQDKPWAKDIVQRARKGLKKP